MKKAFIYGWFSFPRGGANANYVQYLALALIQAGFETTIICNITQKGACELYTQSGLYKYKNIPVKFIRESGIKVIHYIQFNFFRGQMYVDALKRAGAASGDWLIAYCTDAVELRPVLKYADHVGAHTAICLPEYYTREVFSSDKQYRQYISCMENLVPKADVLFPISEFIYKKYNKNQAMLLPCMADTSEYVYHRRNCRSEKIHIIYATNGWVKDSLKEMLYSLLLLPQKDRSHIKLHLTGVKPTSIEEINDERITELMGEVIEIYPWMTYDQLVKLYQNMDYMFIARPDTPFFQANFPSKIPEAMTYGVIPIVSKVGDYTNCYLTDGFDSIQFEGHNSEACAKALTRAIYTPNEALEIMREHARDTVKKRFDFGVWSEMIKNFLEDHQ